MKGALNLPYREDIDGLRAIAILCVVLYHIRAPGMSGGFVGVDIFFPISGFLIFSLLSREREQSNRVDWIAFFARRVRRLLPEVTVMVIVVLALGYFVLLPIGGQQSLAQAGIAAGMWVANIFFGLFGRDYFAASVERQPLLHLWSLSLEEQFYLVLPLVFVVSGHLSRDCRNSWSRVSAVILAITWAGSLLSAVWAAQLSPTIAFYLLPTRAYEFITGIFAAYALRHSRGSGVSALAGQLAIGVGVLGIVLSVAICSEGQPFPGLWALLPTTSAALVLWGGGLGRHTAAARVIGAPAVAYLGKLSYGWYLWHFPALVLWREYWLHDTSLVSEALIAGLMLLPAALGHHFVEKLRFAPRLESVTNVGTLRRAAVATVIIVGLSGVLGVHSRYVGSNTPEIIELRSLLEDVRTPPEACFTKDRGPAAITNDCVFGDPGAAVTIIVWGDSHADHWVPALDAVFKEAKIRGVEKAWAGCAPMTADRGANEAGKHWQECHDYYDKVLSDIRAERTKHPVGVILSARWNLYANRRAFSKLDQADSTPEQVGSANLGDSIAATLSELALLNIPVGVMLQVPEQPYVVPLCLFGRTAEACAVAASANSTYSSAAIAIFSGLVSRDSILDPATFLCGRVRCDVTLGETVLYSDDDHLSVGGARALAPYLNTFVGRIRLKTDQAAYSQVADGQNK